MKRESYEIESNHLSDIESSEKGFSRIFLDGYKYVDWRDNANDKESDDKEKEKEKVNKAYHLTYIK